MKKKKITILLFTILIILSLGIFSFINSKPINKITNKSNNHFFNNYIKEKMIELEQIINQEKQETDNPQEEFTQTDEIIDNNTDNGIIEDNIESISSNDQNIDHEITNVDNYTNIDKSYTNNDNSQEETIHKESTKIVNEGTYNPSTAREILNLVNDARIENNLQPLVWNNSLEQSAMTRAKEIVQVFDHYRPNGDAFYTTVDTDYYIVGENIAVGQSTANVVFEMWMNSPGHRSNILNPEFTDMGVALYYDENSEYKYNWVQLFIGR